MGNAVHMPAADDVFADIFMLSFSHGVFCGIWDCILSVPGNFSTYFCFKTVQSDN